jgi:hypothetical protein
VYLRSSFCVFIQNKFVYISDFGYELSGLLLGFVICSKYYAIVNICTVKFMKIRLYMVLCVFRFSKSLPSFQYPPKLNSEYYWHGSDRIHCACWFLYVSTILWLTHRDCRIFMVRAWCSVYRLIRRTWESPAPSNSGVSYELENPCPWWGSNPEPLALETDALPLALSCCIYCFEHRV